MRAVLAVLVLLSACASPVAPRGAMPAAPGPDALRNDGSDVEKDRLLQRYGVRMQDERVEVADAVRPARAGIVGTSVDGDVASYLGNSVEADAGSRTALGSAGLGLMGLSVVVLFAGMPVPFLVGLAAVSLVDVLTRALVANPSTRAGAIQINILISIVATLTVSAVGGFVVLPGMALFAGGALLLQQARRMTLGALTNAAAAFNADLKHRIDDATTTATPAAAPATEPPPPPPAEVPDGQEAP